MKRPFLCLVALSLLAGMIWPGLGETSTNPLRIVQDRTYRLGVFLVTDAVVQNASPRRVDWAEVSVEYYSYFDELRSVEHTVLRPSALGSGQRATLRVATPFNEAVRKIRYRFTWQQDQEQFQNRPEHEPPSWR